MAEQFFLIEKASQAWTAAGPYAPVLAGGFVIAFLAFIVIALQKSGIKIFSKYPIGADIREVRAGGDYLRTKTALRKVPKVVGGKKLNFYERQDNGDQFPATGFEHIMETAEKRGSGAAVVLWSPRRGEYHPVEFVPSPKGGWEERLVISEEMLQWKLANDDYIDSQHKVTDFWASLLPYLPMIIGIFGLIILMYSNSSLIERQVSVGTQLVAVSAQQANASMELAHSNLEIAKQMAVISGHPIATVFPGT